MANPEIKRLLVLRDQLEEEKYRFRNYVKSLKSNEHASMKEIERYEALLARFNDIQSRLELLRPHQCNYRKFFEDDYHNLLHESYQKTENLQGAVGFSHERLDNKTLNRRLDSSECFDQPLALKYEESVGKPKFSGELSEWAPFSVLFQKFIKENENLTDSEKIQKLESCLEGEALRWLQHINYDSLKFSEAWNALKDMCDEKMNVINEHMKNLLKVKTTTANNINNMRKVGLSDLLKNLKALSEFNCSKYEWNQFLLRSICEEFNESVAERWIDCSENHTPTIEKLMVFLEQEVSKSNERSCDICQGSHCVSECETFLKLSVLQRLSKMNDLNTLCRNCFKPHPTYECTSGIKCSICQKKHHILLHMTENQPIVVPPPRPRNLCRVILLEELKIVNLRVVTIQFHKFHKFVRLANSKNNYISISLAKSMLLPIGDYNHYGEYKEAVKLSTKTMTGTKEEVIQAVRNPYFKIKWKGVVYEFIGLLDSESGLNYMSQSLALKLDSTLKYQIQIEKLLDDRNCVIM